MQRWGRTVSQPVLPSLSPFDRECSPISLKVPETEKSLALTLRWKRQVAGSERRQTVSLLTEDVLKRTTEFELIL